MVNEMIFFFFLNYIYIEGKINITIYGSGGKFLISSGTPINTDIILLQ